MRKFEDESVIWMGGAVFWDDGEGRRCGVDGFDAAEVALVFGRHAGLGCTRGGSLLKGVESCRGWKVGYAGLGSVHCEKEVRTKLPD